VETGLKAKLINDHFASIGTVDNGRFPAICIAAPRQRYTIHPIFKISVVLFFTADSVKRAFKKLKSDLSSGPDDLPPLLFKLSHVFAYLFLFLAAFFCLLCRVYTSATCCAQQASSCAQLVARNLLRWCKRGITLHRNGNRPSLFLFITRKLAIANRTCVSGKN